MDPDSSSEGHVRYNITGGDVNTFYIHPSSGQIFLRRTVYQDHRDNYTLTVTAADQDGKVDTAKISVSITYLKLYSLVEFRQNKINSFIFFLLRNI